MMYILSKCYFVFVSYSDIQAVTKVGSINEVLISPCGERLLKLISQRKLDLLVVSLPLEATSRTDVKCTISAKLLGIQSQLSEAGVKATWPIVAIHLF